MFRTTDSRIAVLEAWKTSHDVGCEHRYVAIENKLEKIEQRFEQKLKEQTDELRQALKEHSFGIYKMLWPLLLMVIGGMATMIYNLVPALHLVK